MGEWSEYFEDFPEENSANYVNGRFDPKGAEARRVAEAKRVRDQVNLDAEVRAIVQKHRAAAAGKK